MPHKLKSLCMLELWVGVLVMFISLAKCVHEIEVSLSLAFSI
jgi:hypothetical protein